MDNGMPKVSRTVDKAVELMEKREVQAEAVDRRLREGKETKESKEYRELRDTRPVKDQRGSKDVKERRDTRGENREVREDKEEKRDDRLREDRFTKDERYHEERFREEKFLEEKLVKALKILAPGTALRSGIENILRGKMGALIVVGDSPQVMAATEGGFKIDCEFTPAYLYELAKMDGAIILSHDARRILYANTQLVPNPELPSHETGIRHRTAERMARQTGELVIAISQRRSLITLYQGPTKYMLQDIGLLLVKANQALQTLEKYRMVLDKDLISLSALEFEDMVTVFEVARVIQRCQLVIRIVKEIEGYICELGSEGRLVSMQMHELAGNAENEVLLVIQDYGVFPNEKSPREIQEQLNRWTSEELTDLVAIGRALGYGASASILDLSVSSRGYRILQKVPRLPTPIISNLVETIGNLPSILKASIEELDEVEGIGEVRARAIKNGLKRLQEQVILDQRI